MFCFLYKQEVTSDNDDTVGNNIVTERVNRLTDRLNYVVERYMFVHVWQMTIKCTMLCI